MSDRKSYSAEIKQEILDKIKSGAKAVDVAQSYGINVKRIYNWAEWKVSANPSVMETGKLARENKALKELIGELTLEIKKFKKNIYGK
jgi:transposase-like protein